MFATTTVRQPSRYAWLLGVGCPRAACLCMLWLFQTLVLWKAMREHPLSGLPWEEVGRMGQWWMLDVQIERKVVGLRAVGRADKKMGEQVWA